MRAKRLFYQVNNREAVRATGVRQACSASKILSAME